MSSRNGDGNGNGLTRHYVTPEELNNELAGLNASVMRQGEDVSILKQGMMAAQKDIQSLSGSVQRDMIGLSTAVEKLGTRVEASLTAVSTKGTFTVRDMWSGLGGVAIVLGGVAWLITNQAGQYLSPVSEKTSRLESQVTAMSQDLRVVAAKADASQQADAGSLSNRREMGARLDRIEQKQSDINSDLKALISKTEAMNIEAETQFSKISDNDNLRWIDEHRRYAIVFRKVFEMDWPSAAFFPPKNYREVK